MDQDVISNTIVINFILKGGPPWGFRIKQRGNKVIISKVNCGGRAHKNGLKVNDEIVAVNNLEIDKHPLTLARNVDESSPEDIENQSIKLTKLDFTYQLIKHTLNRQLHLTARRYTDLEIVQPCCYFIEDDSNNEVIGFPFCLFYLFLFYPFMMIMVYDDYVSDYCSFYIVF
uniref:PDZ domain-containing protein n=1 Tax=Tetranychus urticae TaxID=32264 RepID=T1JWL1_TETUR